jgi:hypothetical protein
VVGTVQVENNPCLFGEVVAFPIEFLFYKAPDEGKEQIKAANILFG